LDSELTELEGQDGYLQAGVPFPEPRFVDNRDGTVKDNMTGLIWLKNPSCLRSKMTWKEALIEVKKLRENDDAYKDCRVENNVNWRMPNIKELQSLVDFGSFNPALPNKNWRMVPDCDDKAKDDCPSPCNEKENQCVFLGVEGGRFYWSSTSRIDSTNDNASGSKAWGVHFREGRTLAHFKSHDLSCELPFEERRCLFDEKLGIRPPYPDKCCKTKNPKPDDCCVRVKFAVWPVYGPELSTRLGVGNSCAKVEITGQETCWDPRTETN
jgi:hypothetical protein